MKLNSVKPKGYKKGIDFGSIYYLPRVDIPWSKLWKIFIVLNLLAVSWCAVYNLHVFVSNNLHNKNINQKLLQEELVPIRANLEQLKLKTEELDSRSITTYQYITKYRYKDVDPSNVKR